MNEEVKVSLIKHRIEESIQTKQMLLKDENIVLQIQKVVDLIAECFKSGGKILLCGNGGSASDALHIAGELVGRFQKERRAFPAIALNADNAVITAISNDYGYDALYERQVEGLLNKGDILIGISTSGNSENVCRAVKKANMIGGHTVALLGRDGGMIKNNVEIAVIVPSECTARIQESHILIGHIICELVEEIYNDQKS